MSSGGRKGGKKPTDDLDLAALVSNIKKNVGGTSKPAPAPVTSSSKPVSSSKSKSKSQEPEKKAKKLDLVPEKPQEPKEKKPRLKALEDDSSDLPPPPERKRSRKVAKEDLEEDNGKDEAWDDTFEKGDIDEIFGQLKTKKEAAANALREKEEDQALLKLLQRHSDKSENNSVALRTQANRDPKRRYTEDGLPIYTTEELGLSEKGGDTDLCPFDCQCCF